MAVDDGRGVGWFPQRGTWEESVLSWNEQIDSALRNSKAMGLRTKREAETIDGKRREIRRELAALR